MSPPLEPEPIKGETETDSFLCHLKPAPGLAKNKNDEDDDNNDDYGDDDNNQVLPILQATL